MKYYEIFKNLFCVAHLTCDAAGPVLLHNHSRIIGFYSYTVFDFEDVFYKVFKTQNRHTGSKSTFPNITGFFC
jgi:hypothetical protein